MRIIFPRMETLEFHKAYDGGAKFIHYLSQYLVKNGVDVTIVTTKLRKKDTSFHKLKGVEYIFLPIKYTGDRFIPFNVFYKFIYSFLLNHWIKRNEVDILHSAEAFSFFYLMNKHRKKVIFQCWGLEPFYGPESLSQKGLKKLYVKLFLRAPWKHCINKSDSIAIDGKFQVQKVSSLGVPKYKMFILPNGVNIKGIINLKKQNKRKKLKIKKDDLVLLSVCQIANDKGVNDIIDAFSIVHKKIKKSKLIMIGKGPLEKKMHSYINHLNLQKEIIHLKNIPEKELYNYYFSSDIFISASLQHDFKICIQEAMACGMPIISYAQPFLVKNGFNGFVTKEKTPKGIAKSVFKIIKNKSKKKMGINSRAMAFEYDWDNLAKLAIKEYKNLLK